MAEYWVEQTAREMVVQVRRLADSQDRMVQVLERISAHQAAIADLLVAGRAVTAKKGGADGSEVRPEG